MFRAFIEKKRIKKHLTQKLNERGIDSDKLHKAEMESMINDVKIFGDYEAAIDAQLRVQGFRYQDAFFPDEKN